MSEFIASNGVTIHRLERGYGFSGTADEVIGERSGAERVSRHGISDRKADALREFFRAEEDEHLGRWRWPENPDYVVYAIGESGDAVNVMSEINGMCGSFTREPVNDPIFGLPLESGNPNYSRAARSYFDAHPGPKPWHAARAGEVWDVDLDSGGMRAVTITSANYPEPTTVFRDAHTQVEVELDDAYILDARRVWPKDAS